MPNPTDTNVTREPQPDLDEGRCPMCHGIDPSHGPGCRNEREVWL
jgi:hypothetical protein